MVDVVLVARVRKVDEGAVGGKEPYEAGDGEFIEKDERGEIGSLLQREWRFCGSL
jgi:hypothetical protein